MEKKGRVERQFVSIVGETGSVASCCINSSVILPALHDDNMGTKVGSKFLFLFFFFCEKKCKWFSPKLSTYSISPELWDGIPSVPLETTTKSFGRTTPSRLKIYSKNYLESQ